MTAATKKAAVQRKSTTKKVVSESVDSEGGQVVNLLPTPEDAAVQAIPSPYPDGIGVWTYQPNDEKLDPILLPLSGFDAPTKLWYFDLAQLPILAQTWRWMDRANVPKHVQRQTQLLDDSEYFAMFNQWLDAMKAGKAPKGAVTAGK